MIIKKYKIYLENLYLLILGILTSFSLPPYNYWFINFFTFTLLFIILFKNKNKSIKSFFFYGYSYGFGYFVSNLYWIPLSLLYDENFKFLIPFAVILVPAFISLFYALAFSIFKLISNSTGIFTNILTLSLIIGLFEFLRGKILTGFPWNLFAYSFSDNIEIIQITSLIGIYAFNTILITIFSAPSILYLSRKKNELAGLCLAILVSFSLYLYGNIKVNNFKNLQVKLLPLEIKVLSTNISIERFYSNFDNEEILKKLINLSNPRAQDNTIFIWPEGIIPGVNLTSLKYEFDYLFKNSFSKNHKIILGVNNDEIEKEKKIFYNSLSLIDNHANIIHKYYKNKLVPFGEFLPFENILSKIGLKTLTNNYQSYSASLKREPFNVFLEPEIRILPLICYEIIYSGNLSKDYNYNFIVNISEDGWFGNSIGPHQHFAHSVFRSVEYGKYTLRSANNGISAIVDPTGSIIDKLNINSEGAISLKEIVTIDRTIFSTYGNKIYFLIILLYIFLIFSFKKLENE